MAEIIGAKVTTRRSSDETSEGVHGGRAVPYADLQIPALIANRARNTPDAIALQMQDELLTYRELDERSNQLARYLLHLNVGPDVLVGLCIERGFRMVIGMLSVLKVGGACLPLDPTYPPERVDYMLLDSGARTVITTTRTNGLFAKYSGSKIDLDIQETSIGSDCRGSMSHWAHPSSLAYVTYTSGSTGKPKGILTTRGGLENYIDFFRRQYSLVEKDVVLNVSSIAFDASARDIYAPLCSGARVVLLRSSQAKEPRYIRSVAAAASVTVIPSIVPSLLDEIANSGSEQESIESLRIILTSGEVLLSRVARTVREKLSRAAEIVNQYGPTEGTMTSTYFRLPRDLSAAEVAVPVGSAITNVTTWVLNEQLESVREGAVGELYIGGVGLARGYQGRPGLTAERFVPDPYEAGARLYRTGDLVCQQSTGCLRFVGRLDHQVKINGNRVELGEIEATMMEYGAVERAAVVVKEDECAGARLIGYVVSGKELDIADFRLFLMARLLRPMVPSTIVQLTRFPETDNGKIDRSRLPEPATQRNDATSLRSPTEYRLACLWREVLRLPNDVDRSDDFFVLGGSSLLAMRLTLQIFTVFSVDIPMHTVFEAPTVAALSRIIDDEQSLARADPDDASDSSLQIGFL